MESWKIGTHEIGVELNAFFFSLWDFKCSTTKKVTNWNRLSLSAEWFKSLALVKVVVWLSTRMVISPKSLRGYLQWLLQARCTPITSVDSSEPLEVPRKTVGLLQILGMICWCIVPYEIRIHRETQSKCQYIIIDQMNSVHYFSKTPVSFFVKICKQVVLLGPPLCRGAWLLHFFRQLRKVSKTIYLSIIISCCVQSILLNCCAVLSVCWNPPKLIHEKKHEVPQDNGWGLVYSIQHIQHLPRPSSTVTAGVQMAHGSPETRDWWMWIPGRGNGWKMLNYPTWRPIVKWMFPKIGVGPQNAWFISWKTRFFNGWFGGTIFFWKHPNDSFYFKNWGIFWSS